VIGRFYLDMHPRPDKFNHAAQFGLRPGVRDHWLPEAVLVCNFPEPKEGDPALLTHMDVETFFHEFGHLLHTLLGGKHRWAGVSGIKTEYDFVEAPSQLLEEWVRQPKLLQSFAAHHQTGEPIPTEMVEKINRAGRFGRGLWVSRQALYAAISLQLHQQSTHPVDTDAVVKGILREASPFPVPEEMHFEASFGHLTGYSAIYYTYLWSLTISKDLFSAFDAQNLMEPRVARRYRERVLAPGGSRPADQLIRDFLGRDFSLEPFKEWLNEGDMEGAGAEPATSAARP
jgi:thimet oligopeptidase